MDRGTCLPGAVRRYSRHACALPMLCTRHTTGAMLGRCAAHREARGDCFLERRHTLELGQNVVRGINDVHRGPRAAGVVRLVALQPRRKGVGCCSH